MTLDGVVEAPERWCAPLADRELHALLSARAAQQDLILLGRRTYEDFARFWPASAGPLAAHVNATRKLVVSETLAGVRSQNAALIEEPIAQELPELKHANGQEIAVMGSITLVQSLLRRGLVDELRLLVHPVTVGSGRRLVEGALAEGQPRLIVASALSSGVLDLAYAPPQRGLLDAGSGRRNGAGWQARHPARHHAPAESGAIVFARSGCSAAGAWL
jgi:dihydrofolate reductase